MVPLIFDLYTNATLLTSTAATLVYLDNTTSAVENRPIYEDASYGSKQITGSNGRYSAITTTTITGTNDTFYRIRILRSGSLVYCTSWFRLNNNGYGEYIPFVSNQGPNTGLYRITIPYNYYSYTRYLSGSTSLGNCYETTKDISVNLYLFYGGASNLISGNTWPSCIGTCTTTIGDTYTIYLPATTNSTASTNSMTYLFGTSIGKDYSYTSFVNDYELEAPSASLFLTTGGTLARDLLFSPAANVVTTGKMAEAVSYYGNEFYSTQNQCIKASVLSSNGFVCEQSGDIIPRFTTVLKKCPFKIHIITLSNATVNSINLTVSGTSRDVYYFYSPTYPNSSSVSGQLLTHTFFYEYYTPTTMAKTVNINIGGYITSVGSWYYKVVDYKTNTIVNTVKLQSSTYNFKVPVSQLDGLFIFFSTASTISLTYYNGTGRAQNGLTNYTVSSTTASWSSGGSTGGGTTTTSLASIGEWDY